ncbi:site-specific integrase [Paenibacillus sp. FSL W8-0194]|uniref:site-specific integrase n=1 Tax=Paenibacillus sp. FSL W8-0194 TaxID=2921711 RepID=UPI0030DB6D79
MSVKKDEKRGTFYFVIDAGKDEHGKRKQIKKRGFRTEKDAKREMRKVQQQLDDNTYVKPSNMLFSEFLKEWLVSKSVKLRKVTLESYTQRVDHHISPALGHYELTKISTAMIEKFYIKLKTEKQLSERSILDIHKVLKSSFDAAVKRKYVSYNPVKDAETPKVSQKEMTVWDLPETLAFLHAARDNRLYIAFLLALNTGMRQSEILGLTWKDVDLENGTLTVRQTLSHDGKELSPQTKTKASTRSISLNNKLIAELKKHKRILAREKLACGPLYKDMNLVVCTSNGTPVIPRNVLRSFYAIIKKAEVPRIRFHDLRHTVATLMLKEGINPKIVKEILGHSDIRITLDTYSHVLPSIHKDTAQKYGDMLFGKENML